MPAMDLLAEGYSIILSARLEIAMFFTAFVVYAFLNMHRTPKLSTKKLKSAKLACDEDESESTAKSTSVNPRIARKHSRSSVVSVPSAVDCGDHRAVIKFWDAGKHSDATLAMHLPSIVESMQSCKKDGTYIFCEVDSFFRMHPSQCNISLINGLLESVGRHLDANLVNRILKELPSWGLEKDQHTYEVLLSMHLNLRNFDDVRELVADMKTYNIPFTSRALLTSAKAALRRKDFDGALQGFKEFKSSLSSQETWSSSPSLSPGHMVSQLVELACEERQLHRFLPELENVPITEDVLNSMLVESTRLRDQGMARDIEKLARATGDTLSDVTFSLLVKALADDAGHVRAIIQEVTTMRGKQCSYDFVFAALGFCAKSGDIALGDALFEQTKPHSLKVSSAFIRFYLEVQNFDRACDIFETQLQVDSCGGNASMRSAFDARMERSLLNAALSCGRSSLANLLLESSPSDVSKHLTMIQKCASENNLAGAVKVFESLEKSGIDLNSVVYNTVLEACVQCHEFSAAEKWMKKCKEAGMADVVSYNTLIKAQLLNKRSDKARALMQEMKQSNVEPNRVTYNELINSIIASGASKDDMWEIVQEMSDAGVPPNQVTCSILLKNLNAQSTESDISATMNLLSTLEEQMDEILLSSVVEACVRIGKPDLLSSKLNMLQGSNRISINGAHTYGSLIKAYGRAGDIDAVWRCWKEMRSRHIRPSSITLGCMVEAVVANQDPEGAYDLIQQVQEDDQCRESVNSVMYSSVLKGFAREKKLDRVWSVYEEMERKNVEMSVVVYNTLLDACARAGRMESVPKLLQGMKDRNVRPNLISYSTMVKGHCQSGNIQTAFELVEAMKQDTNLKPDEIMYNSLLDGCAQNNMYEEGLRVLREMEANGVQPSNFTLSVLVKLLNRAYRVDQAFSLVQEISKKYKFKVNVHVYTNLIQACVGNRQMSRAMDTLETMVKESVRPDNRTYKLLVRGSISSNHAEQAVALLRGALGLFGAHPVVARAACSPIDHALVNETLNSLVDRGFTQSLAVPLLTDIKSSRQNIRIDAETQSRVISSSMGQDRTWGVSSSKGKGRGHRTSR